MHRLLYVLVCLTGITEPNSQCIIDNVDYVEINTYYSVRYQEDELPKVNKNFVQIIFWNFDSTTNNYTVVDFRMIHNRPYMVTKNKNIYDFRFYDNNHKVIRIVKAKMVRHTHTLYDPELDDRKIIPSNQRVLLSGKSRKPRTESRPPEP